LDRSILKLQRYAADATPETYIKRSGPILSANLTSFASVAEQVESRKRENRENIASKNMQ